MSDTPELPQKAANAAMVDAIALLKSDHRKVEDLFTQYEGSEDSDEKSALAQQICTELKIHTLIEEEIFYPALEGKIENDTLEEAFVEHDGAKMLVNDIAAGTPADDFYDAKIKVLSEEIKHHVHEEEMPDKGMFAQARASGVDLTALGVELKARKDELMAQAQDDGLPPAKPSVVNAASA
ncbi:hemerythrin domain-containing protein [Novosphingobium fluoreni]|uniref:hemerythrin domain-containing protein n=1 Tax=Novosphingobium fluoreni TaxID=1391222 RepID=UPI003DA1A0CB